jgi:hypothetical protein
MIRILGVTSVVAKRGEHWYIAISAGGMVVEAAIEVVALELVEVVGLAEVEVELDEVVGLTEVVVELVEVVGLTEVEVVGLTEVVVVGLTEVVVVGLTEVVVVGLTEVVLVVLHGQSGHHHGHCASAGAGDKIGMVRNNKYRGRIILIGGVLLY